MKFFGRELKSKPKPNRYHRDVLDIEAEGVSAEVHKDLMPDVISGHRRVSFIVPELKKSKKDKKGKGQEE